ncbi:MAG TPA: 4-hydroxy-3-methylbut-2-enyl diphosphate reductase [Streptosporangiaceae bacterium]
MSRSAVREYQAPGISVDQGCVLIPTEIGDPVRGPLSCPAAPLVGGTLQRKGRSVSYAPVPRCDDPAHDSDGAALFLVTCQQADGGSVALAAAASPADRAAVAAARAAVQEWADVLGTRRLLAAASPLCGGARRALQAVRGATAQDEAQRRVHILGELACSPEDQAELAGRGTVFTASLRDVPDGDLVIIPAHGIAPEVRAEAAERGLQVVDATCPLVAGTQAEARRAAERGDHLVLIGRPDSPAAAGITANAAEATVISSTASSTMVQVADPRRVSYLLQPGIPIEETQPAAAALQSRFPAIRPPNPDGFCYAAADRADTVRAVATGADVVLILGEPGSADTRQLAALVRDCGSRAHTVAASAEITAAMLAGAATIGLTESVTAAGHLASLVISALSGLGPVSVARRQVSTTVAGQPVLSTTAS